MRIVACPVTGHRTGPAAARHGFTLTEIAIVLGIIGLILGAIWVAASSVYNNLRISKSTTELLSIAQATRSLYATATVTGDAAGTDETANFIKAGIFPSDMVPTATSTTTVNSWNGTVMVTSQTVVAAGDAFGIEFNAVPPAPCIALLTSSTGTGRDAGMYFANASTTAKGAAAFGTPTTFPVTAGTAAGLCSGTTSPTYNSVQWVFKLKG